MHRGRSLFFDGLTKFGDLISLVHDQLFVDFTELFRLVEAIEQLAVVTSKVLVLFIDSAKFLLDFFVFSLLAFLVCEATAWRVRGYGLGAWGGLVRADALTTDIT